MDNPSKLTDALRALLTPTPAPPMPMPNASMEARVSFKFGWEERDRAMRDALDAILARCGEERIKRLWDVPNNTECWIHEIEIKEEEA